MDAEAECPVKESRKFPWDIRDGFRKEVTLELGFNG